MNFITRLLIAAGCAALCATGALLANLSHARMAILDNVSALDAFDDGNAYQHVMAEEQFSFGELETIIRRDQRALAHRGRIEFGSIKFEGSSASVHVLFIATNGRMTAYLYRLGAKERSWKIESVQRLWFVSPSQILRGLQV